MDDTKATIGTPTAGARARWAAVGWGVYVACAWTWCIGMFLPVLLVHDFGLGGWFVFAVPNVLGAGAMGWVLARPGSSETLLQAHRPACVAFSAVTLAFHAFFLFWMSRLGVIPLWASGAAIGIGSAVALVARRRAAIDLWLAGAVFTVSLVVLVRGLWSPAIPDLHGNQPPILLNLLALAPVCTFGFLLCPYLDVTFHRAVQATAPHQTSRLAFGLGFGVFFLAMIVLTLLYEGDFNRGHPGARLGSFGAAGLLTWVATHIAVQAGFTWTSHLRALPRPRAADALIWIGALLLAAIGIALAAAGPRLSGIGVSMAIGEVVYRGFMGFYGLVFPTYVWICLLPWRTAGDPVKPPTAALIGLWLIALVLAGPFFWAAFIDRATLWLIPAMAVLLLARWLPALRKDWPAGPRRLPA